MTLLAFHSDPAVKTKYIARVEAHIAADELQKGATGKYGKGCAVWCTLDAYRHDRYPIELGIPEWLARVEDTLFEGMSLGKSSTWPRDFLDACAVGADLDRAKGSFILLVLRSTLDKFDHAKYPAVLAAVEGSIALWERDDVGSPEWTITAVAAWAAATRAEAAARVAAWAAAERAEAAARAAAAARAGPVARSYDRFADGLLDILRGIGPSAVQKEPLSTSRPSPESTAAPKALEPPGCPLPSACLCPGGEVELASRLGKVHRERDAAEARATAAESALAEAREILRQIEWITDVYEDPAGRWGFCPECSRERNHGHTENCRLAAALADAPTKQGGAS